MCQLQGCAHYSDLDLKGVLRRNGLYDKYDGTTFPENGKCSDDPLIVHQYELNTTLNGEGRLQAAHQDIDGYSCLNGWSCGSIAASVPDVANWFWDVFHDKLVNSTTLSLMMNGIPLDSGWSPGLYCRSPFAGVYRKTACSYISRSASGWALLGKMVPVSPRKSPPSTSPDLDIRIRLGAAWQNKVPDQNVPEATRFSLAPVDSPCAFFCGATRL